MEMMQNSDDEFQSIYSKLDQNQSNSMRHSWSHIKYPSSCLDTQPEFLFSGSLVETKHNISPAENQLLFRESLQCHEAVSNRLLKLPPIKKKSTLLTEPDTEDFIPHEVDIIPAKPVSSSSLSSQSTSSVCKEYLLPILSESLESDKAKKQRIIESRWGRGTTFDIGLWEDNIAPIIKIKSRKDIEFDVIATDVLTDEMVGACSSFLSKSPEIDLYIQNKCELMRMSLRDISILYNHHYLQYIDLTNNNISDLTPLGGIRCLIYLNASQNKLRDVLRFTPPWYLTYVNLMRNQISKIDDLSEFWSIVRLDLSHNAIESITGLQNLRDVFRSYLRHKSDTDPHLKSGVKLLLKLQGSTKKLIKSYLIMHEFKLEHLRFLNLGYNLIECVENLDNLNIQELNLEYNCITDFKCATPEFGISTLANLRTLILRHNKLSTLGFFKGTYSLRYIDLRYNKIVDLMEVSHLKSLVYEVDFRGNPCTKWPSYRDVLLFSMPSVMLVDGASVTLFEKVSASTIFAPLAELISARSVTKLMLLEHLNPPNVDLHITPVDQSTPPLIILSGPPAVKKSILARQIADSLPERVRYCASHTTKEPVHDDRDRLSYHFISREEFNEITRRGEFLSTEELLGNSYGFHVSEIVALVSAKKIGITHMDLNAALQMQGRYVNAKLILVLTKSIELHQQWIREKFEVFTWAKNSVQDIVTIKVGRHQRPIVEINESTGRLDFIGELLDELIGTLELPLLSINERSRRTEVIAPNLTIESPTRLPRVTRTESELRMEKKHISFRGEEKGSTSISLAKEEITSNKPAVLPSNELKIILDEQSNIIVENEEQKRERQKAKMLLHHNLIHFQMADGEFIEDEEFGEESVFSDDLFISKPYASGMDSSKVAEELYSNLVIKTRELYLQQHRDNLGFFSLVVFTDEFVSAYNQVIDFIYEFYVNQPLRKPIFSMEIQTLLQTVIPTKTRTFLEELRENLSTSKKQRSLNLRSYGLTSWNQVLPSQLSQNVTQIVAEIEAKRFEELRNLTV